MSCSLTIKQENMLKECDTNKIVFMPFRQQEQDIFSLKKQNKKLVEKKPKVK